MGGLPGREGERKPENTVLALAGRVLVSRPAAGVWKTANLLPRAVTDASRQRMVFRQLGIGFVSFVVAMALVLVAIKASTWRYERELEQLDGAISRISDQGEAVGTRLSQLSAVAEARATDNDFGGVVGDLHAVRLGDGLSYSEVSLRGDGALVLRGQAESLALPFELPQKLEALPSMANVVLKNAGQTKKGEGSITEFRIEATHQRRDQGGTP